MEDAKFYENKSIKNLCKKEKENLKVFISSFIRITAKMLFQMFPNTLAKRVKPDNEVTVFSGFHGKSTSRLDIFLKLSYRFFRFQIPSALFFSIEVDCILKSLAVSCSFEFDLHLGLSVQRSSLGL